jgi:CheY-like chemotaxis protein
MPKTGSDMPWRLLAVDDHHDSADLVARVALQCGYETKIMLDPHRVVEIALEWQPHVISLDLGMPQFDGVDVLLALKDHGFTGQLIIISGQSRTQREHAVRIARVRGVRIAEHFEKPVQIHTLRRLLSALKAAEAA